MCVEEQAIEPRPIGPVECVPADRVTGIGKVDANLVRATGDEVYLEQADRLAIWRSTAADQPKPRERWAARADGHAAVVAWMAPDRSGQRPFRARPVAPDRREICAFELIAGEEIGEAAAGFWCSGEQDQAARVAVESVEEARVAVDRVGDEPVESARR